MNEPSLGTTPFHLSDSSQFFELSKDIDIRNEFPYMRFQDINEAKQYIEHQKQIQEISRTAFFKAIRIIFGEDTGVYTETNSILIGFISLHPTGISDSMLAGGIKETLSYAIKSKFKNKGLMTTALNMTLEAMKEDGFNIAPTIVKPNNEASIRVLNKCGFDLISQSVIASFYVKRISMNESEYKKIFNL